jgi:hypothetical protein
MLLNEACRMTFQACKILVRYEYLLQQQKYHRMSSETVFVLPGDSIDPSLVPSHPKKPLRLGPGLRHVPPNDIIPTLAGQLVTDRQKNAIRVENARGRVRTQFPCSIFSC